MGDSLMRGRTGRIGWMPGRGRQSVYPARGAAKSVEGRSIGKRGISIGSSSRRRRARGMRTDRVRPGAEVLSFSIIPGIGIISLGRSAPGAIAPRWRFWDKKEEESHDRNETPVVGIHRDSCEIATRSTPHDMRRQRRGGVLGVSLVKEMVCGLVFPTFSRGGALSSRLKFGVQSLDPSFQRSDRLVKTDQWSWPGSSRFKG